MENLFLLVNNLHGLNQKHTKTTFLGSKTMDFGFQSKTVVFGLTNDLDIIKPREREREREKTISQKVSH